MVQLKFNFNSTKVISAIPVHRILYSHSVEICLILDLDILQVIEDKYLMSESARQTLETQLLALHEQVGQLSVTSGRRQVMPPQTNGA